MLKNARWIRAASDFGESVPEFLKRFAMTKAVAKAELLITAYGVYAAFLNGKRIGNFVLAPGWTAYGKRLQYQTYDVTDMLSEQNELTVLLGSGWATGRMLWMRTGVRETPKLLALLCITYEDGTTEQMISDQTWLCRASNIQYSDIYDGEAIDMTYVPKAFENAVETTHSYDILIPQEGEFVTEQEALEPVAVIHTPKGETVIDFGQNMTGYPAFTTEGSYGEEIEISFAEVLDKDGNFYTDNYRSAQSKVKYICDGQKVTYKPQLCFQGFRYIRLDSYPGEMTLEKAKKQFRAIVVHSDMPRIGDFSCSSPLVNRLYQNTVWGQKSNFLDIPTDCPQRDERLGWTGDAQVFVRTASYNFHVEKFFRKWLRDMAAEQREDGSIPYTVPKIAGFDQSQSAAWGDAAVICPWQIYLTYGDKSILEDNFDMMKKWVDFLHGAGPEEYLWIGHEHFADWLGLDAPEGSYRGATDPDLIACAYFAYSTSLFIKAGEVLGRDMTEYKDLYQKIVTAYRARFMPDGTLTSDTQTAHAITLYFNLAENKEKIAKRLAELVMENNCKLKTGFVGTPYILHALSDNGYKELAYSLLLQEEYPSWLYPVKQGATTIWEHWDSLKPDGTMWSTDMNSFNHYAYGAVCDWLYGVVCGIGIDEKAPGFRHIVLRPLPDERLQHAQASIQTAYGKVSSAWNYNGDTVEYTFRVPEGCTADIILPDVHQTVPAGEYHFSI